jgi:hypothetical protein
MGSLVGLGKGGSARYHDGRCDHHQGEKQAELERFKHAAKIVIRSGFAKDTAPPTARGMEGRGRARVTHLSRLESSL